MHKRASSHLRSPCVCMCVCPIPPSLPLSLQHVPTLEQPLVLRSPNKPLTVDVFLKGTAWHRSAKGTSYPLPQFYPIRWWSKQNKKLKTCIFYYKYEAKSKLGMAHDLETSKPIPRDILSPERPHLLNLSLSSATNSDKILKCMRL